MVRAARSSLATSSAFGFRNMWASLATEAYRIGTVSRNEHTVRIEPHGRSLHVAADQPVLEAALAAGLNLPHSCKSGHCSSCRARLVAGEVRYPGGRRRSFSIASPPHDSDLLELHVRRVSGGGFTERLFGAGAVDAQLVVGSLLRIEGPIGQFSYREGAGPVLMLAGGTGFAPLKSMLRHALEAGGERDIHLYWGARHAHDIYEQTRVLEWVQRHSRLKFTAVLSEPTATEASHSRVGFVHEAVLADHPDLSCFEVYAAGPPAMIEALRASFPRHGLPAGRLYFDSFDYAPDASRR